MEINVQRIQSYIRENKLSKKAFCEKCKISCHTLQKIISNNFRGYAFAVFRTSWYLGEV